ncbi:hypothetical protein ASC94_14095 [Massilia sp. Root418]|uniref:DUF418 domain-containing protein n=1 Tax=Massilia sp. Root418 TaxID=1736532 RepID=UPI0006F24774|nr:DUF418 domain-containing protein [Massilia sp. Root418]KQW93715.1 hypothetical protein ASC94_14095 [Massilia sp. Root418]
MADGHGQQHRLQHVDALRGFALLGILSVNIWAFADSHFASPTSNPAYGSALDNAVRFAAALLFETKFYLLFSFLFGYSVTLQMDAAARAHAAFLPRMLRRQAGLIALGLLHGALLFYGDIMSLYGALGLVLLARRHWPPARAATAAIWLLGIMGAGWMLFGLLFIGVTEAPPPDPDVIVKLQAFTGSAAATQAYHLGHLADMLGIILLLQGPSAMALFFLGFAAGRLRLFEQPDLYREAARRLLRAGLPMGLAGALCYAIASTYAPGGWFEVMAFGLGQLTAPLLCFSYVAGALLLFARPAGKRIEAALAPMGKMALSNYLLQSLLLGLLFTGYGLRLIDRLSPLAVLACVPPIYALQMLLSRWWLGRYRYGPGEWLLRAATLGAIPPLIR